MNAHHHTTPDPAPRPDGRRPDAWESAGILVRAQGAGAVPEPPVPPGER